MAFIDSIAGLGARRKKPPEEGDEGGTKEGVGRGKGRRRIRRIFNFTMATVPFSSIFVGQNDRIVELDFFWKESN